jgi:hypothetical protein
MAVLISGNDQNVHSGLANFGVYTKLIIQGGSHKGMGLRSDFPGISFRMTRKSAAPRLITQSGKKVKWSTAALGGV